MGSLTKSNPVLPQGVRKQPIVDYTGFNGLDTSRAPEALENPEKLPAVRMINCFADWRGFISNEPPLIRVVERDANIIEIVFYARDKVCFAHRSSAGVSLRGDEEQEIVDVYPPNGVVASCVFNRKAMFFCKGFDYYSFNGFKFNRAAFRVETRDRPPLRPAFGVAIQRRLAVAGVSGNPTTVYISRVDDEAVMPDDEPIENEQVTRAGKIDIGNLLSSAEEIQGLGVIEKNKLCIFTNDQVLVYTIDPDINLWAIDQRSSLQIGCVSHRTIVNAGNDLIFCSRGGVYSLRRSVFNGLTLFAVPLSTKIQELYLQLVQRVPNKDEISAVFDQDQGHYHIFFPVNSESTIRLTLNVTPSADEQTPLLGFWSTGRGLNARCGTFLGGNLVFGTPFGAFNVGSRFESGDRPVGEFTTPVLWSLDSNNQKMSKALSVQVDGVGDIEILAKDESGRELSTITIRTGEIENGDYLSVPAIRQYLQPFEHSFRGVQLTFKLKSRSEIRIYGFSIHYRPNGA